MTTTASWKHNTGLPLISSSLRNRRLRPQPVEEPSGPTPDKIITGTITPNATGQYFQIADYLGWPCYQSADTLWFISRFELFGPWTYCLTMAPGDYLPATWFRPGYANSPDGDYQPLIGVTGVATVSNP